MRLDQYLKQHGITQREFAEAIGCEQPTVARFVNGDRIPSVDLMRAIAEHTGGTVMPNDFFGIESHPTREGDAA